MENITLTDEQRAYFRKLYCLRIAPLVEEICGKKIDFSKYAYDPYEITGMMIAETKQLNKRLKKIETILKQRESQDQIELFRL